MTPTSTTEQHTHESPTFFTNWRGRARCPELHAREMRLRPGVDLIRRLLIAEAGVNGGQHRESD